MREGYLTGRKGRRERGRVLMKTGKRRESEVREKKGTEVICDIDEGKTRGLENGN